MVETTEEASSTAAEEAAPIRSVPKELSVPALIEVGAHFGHQTRRWDPRMKPFIYGERHGIHILDLDLTARRFREALDFLRETVASGGKVLFVGTKRQAQAPVQLEAERCGQFYVNNRWLGGMLTNFRTVKKSIERFKQMLELLADEEKTGELSKKELSRINRSVIKYRKSLDGIREMSRPPDAIFVIDIKREHIALSEAQRLGIPLVAIVDSNCNPKDIDYVVPANDDAIRAIQLYCALAADACMEGAELYNERVQSEATERAAARAEGAEAPSTGRRVVEIKQQPRRGRGAQAGAGPGGHGGAGHGGPRGRRGGRPAAGGPGAVPAAAAEREAPEVPEESKPEPPAVGSEGAPAEASTPES